MTGSCLYELWLPEFPVCLAIFCVSHSQEIILCRSKTELLCLAAGSNGGMWCFETSLGSTFGKNKCLQYKKKCLEVAGVYHRQVTLVMTSVQKEEDFFFFVKGRKQNEIFTFMSTGSFVNGCIQKIFTRHIIEASLSFMAPSCSSVFY